MLSIYTYTHIIFGATVAQEKERSSTHQKVAGPSLALAVKVALGKILNPKL